MDFKRFYTLRLERITFLQIKDQNTDELEDIDWIQDLAFYVDMTGHIFSLNIKLQGTDKNICDTFTDIKGFR